MKKGELGPPDMATDVNATADKRGNHGTQNQETRNRSTDSPTSSLADGSAGCTGRTEEIAMPTDIIHTPPTLELPNFDAMTPDDLWAFWHKWHLASRRQTVTLVGVRKNALKYTYTLANYACNKAVAMTCRAKGDIVQAQNYEHNCDALYEQLPADLKW